MTLPETTSSRWAATEGLPFPLGPTRIEEEDACNFALYSKHAQSVTLLLYTERDSVNPVFEYRFDYLKNKTGRVWHCRIPFVSMQGACYYAYRVEGPAPNGRFEWHGFDRDKTVKAQHNKFREMVKALHQADIEVVLDVVYNHTGEGDHAGPVYSYKGIDNSTYYMMADRPDAPYENFSGTGNTLNTANRAVRKMIIDSARHWSHEMHVDGFRFDLASLFTRKADGSVNANDVPLLSDMASDPDLAHLRLIAEPWDAAGVYQLGRAFPGIMACQWNGRYRDDLRRFVKGDPGMVPALMRRLYGSDDLFPDDRMNAYHPHQSVNYLASHDGFNVRWYGVGREPDLSFDSRSLAFALHGASQRDNDLYVMINAYWDELTFQVQEGTTNEWRRVVDTSLESPFDFLEPGNESPLPSLHYRVPGRAVVVLVRDQDGG